MLIIFTLKFYWNYCITIKGSLGGKTSPGGFGIGGGLGGGFLGGSQQPSAFGARPGGTTSPFGQVAGGTLAFGAGGGFGAQPQQQQVIS